MAELMIWHVWRDGNEYDDDEPWAAEAWDWRFSDSVRKRFQTWRAAFDYAFVAAKKDNRHSLVDREAR